MRRAGRYWLLLAAPALVLRALVPPGFMPVAAEQGFALEFCPGAAALPAGAALASAHAHHHHGHGGGPAGDPSSPAHHAPCVFAASALLGPVPAGAAVPVMDVPERVVARLDPGAQLHLPSIVRAQSPRGPPELT
jgi:hypothetical protein